MKRIECASCGGSRFRIINTNTAQCRHCDSVFTEITRSVILAISDMDEITLDDIVVKAKPTTSVKVTQTEQSREDEATGHEDKGPLGECIFNVISAVAWLIVAIFISGVINSATGVLPDIAIPAFPTTLFYGAFLVSIAIIAVRVVSWCDPDSPSWAGLAKSSKKCKACAKCIEVSETQVRCWHCGKMFLIPAQQS